MPASDFLLCHNPFTRLREGIDTLMYHSVSPRYLSYVLSIDMTSEYPLAMGIGINKGFLYLSATGDPEVYFIVVTDNTNKASAQKLSAVLQQQAQFYANHLNLPNKGREKQGSWVLFTDYNDQTPGLQIIQIQPQKTFIVSHPRGVTNFPDEEDLFDFLTDALQYSEEVLSKGSYNIIDNKTT
jgi:hypothetical protein